jgi:putative glycerol-1-phosphate prenyltransferase
MWELGSGKIWVLYDPDKLEVEEFYRNIRGLNDLGAILVGTSFSEGDICPKVKKLKELSDYPVILFPGSVYQLCPYYDYVLFLSLISGRNPEYLIGEHVKAAPLIKKFNLRVIPTAYLLIDGGTYTATEFITNTKPLPRNKFDLILAHCLAAKYLGFSAIYLEAGSGAILNVPYEVVNLVKEEVGLPLIVGGGIRLREQVDKYFSSGADIVVIGSAFEDDDRKI